MSSDGLRSALASLDRHWAERDRGWLGGLRAGLTLDKIDDAERAIRPMLFTEEHRVLYAWHDGDGERHAFGEDWPPFLPLMEAIELWRFGVKELGWTPCWMPLLNMGLDYRVSLVDSLRHDESGVLDYYLQAEPTALVPSIEALVRWRLACLMTGAGRDESKALRHQFEAPILVRGEPISPRISAVGAHDWPFAWKEAAGIDVAAEAPIGKTTSIAKLRSGETARGVIEGRVSWLGGGMDSSIAQIDDGTGRALVACPKGTPGVRELGMDFVVEVTVGPRTGRLDDDLTWLEGVMGHADFVAESVRYVRSLRPEDAQ